MFKSHTFGAGDGDNADDNDNTNGNRVEVVVTAGEAVGRDTEVFGLVVAEGGKVGGPRPCHGGTTDDILEENVSGGYECHEFAELHSEVCERASCEKFGSTFVFGYFLKIRKRKD